MKPFNCFAILLLMGLVASSASAASVADANVANVGLNGNGRLLIRLDKAVPEPGCSTTDVLVAPTHPHVKSLLAIALAARTAGRTVTVYSEGCKQGFATIGVNGLLLLN